MLLYVLMRLHVFGRTSDVPIEIPKAAWASTAIILLEQRYDSPVDSGDPF